MFELCLKHLWVSHLCFVVQRRLQDELPMGRVSAAAEASNVLLQLHLAARGAMAFLRSGAMGNRVELSKRLNVCIVQVHTRYSPYMG